MNSWEWREWKWQRPGDVSGDRFDALLFDLEAAEKAAPDSGLRDALKPFAEFANEYLGNSRSQPKSGEVYTVHFTDNGPKSITIEMLKAAQSALQSPAPQGDVK